MHDNLMGMDDDHITSGYGVTDSDSNDDTIIGQNLPLVRCAQNSLLCVALIASN